MDHELMRASGAATGDKCLINIASGAVQAPIGFNNVP